VAAAPTTAIEKAWNASLIAFASEARRQSMQAPDP
jgi:hypothetical protein